eukprot:5192427-Amphidinium_carterae.1
MDGQTRLQQQLERLRAVNETGKTGIAPTFTCKAEPPETATALVDLLRKELSGSAHKARCWGRQANRFISTGGGEGWSMESGERLSPQVSDIKVELDLGHALHWKAIRNAMRLFVALRAQVAEKDALTAELRQ